MSGADCRSLKVVELRAALKAKRMSVSGNKPELIRRLQSSLERDASVNDEAIRMSAILNEEEEEVKGTAASAEESSPALDTSDTTSVSPIKSVSKLEDMDMETMEDMKVTETRTFNVVSKIDVIKDIEGTEDTEETELTTDPETEKNTTCISPVSKIVSKMKNMEVDLDKIKARAERFGVVLSEETKKAARAAKFGTGTAALSADLDTLRRRAERFGTSTSSSLRKMEVNEAIRRRQERFGVVDKNELNKPIRLNRRANSVKMRTRAQRFGLTS